MSSENGFDVMHQFKIEKVLDLHLFGLDISLTNSGVTAMFISASLILVAFFGLRSKNPKMLFILEKIYSSVNGIVQKNIGEESKKYINFKKPKNIQPHMKMTNETGIYLILSKSTKPKKAVKEERERHVPKFNRERR